MPGRKREGGRKRAGAGARDGASDLLQLVIAYAKQETLDPVVRQAKKLGWGIGGGLCMALGTALLALGFVRALQTEFGSGRVAVGGGLAALSPRPVILISPLAPAGRTSAPIIRATRSLSGRLTVSPFGAGAHLSGDWSWVPYMGGVLFCLLIAGFCVSRIMKGFSR